jgi:2-polyprenyl-6-methoxyphenol hydroxylase-like FAD-dependent oxidoreductase
MAAETAAGPDVLVVGAGPVGLTMALELARHGLACRIIDAAPQPTDKSKALVLWGRSLELLSGNPALAGDLVAAGQFVRAGNVIGNGKRLLRVEFDRDDTAFPRPLMLPQCDTERILSEHLHKAGVVVERAVELVDFFDDGDRVLARLRHAGGRDEIVQTHWLVGCDGAHSTVRKQLRIEFIGQFEPNDWMLADVRLEGPVEHDALSIFWHARGIVALFPIRGDRFRVVADVGPSPGTDKPRDPTLDEVQATLLSRGLEAVRAFEPVWLAGFRIHERKVDPYGLGRVFLAGDAAHIHSPAGGQGMNTGMQDAFNLAWKLALVVGGAARETLLDSYTAERSAVGEMVLRNATRLTQLATVRNPLLQFVRNHAALLAGRLSAVQQRFVADLTELAVHYPKSPLNADDPGHAWDDRVKPGDRLPDARLHEGFQSEPTSLLAALRCTGHALLMLPESNDAELLAALEAGASSLIAVFGSMLTARLILPQGSEGDAPRALVDVEGRLRERLGVRGTAIALVRPDRYLAFRGHAGSFARLGEHLHEYLLPAATNVALATH